MINMDFFFDNNKSTLLIYIMFHFFFKDTPGFTNAGHDIKNIHYANDIVMRKYSEKEKY